MTAPIIRIGLRWVGGFLIAKGYFAQSEAGLFTDPDLVAAASYGAAALVGLASEGWYWIAKRMKWAT